MGEERAKNGKSRRGGTTTAEEYEQMKETMEILADPTAVRRILESIAQARKEKTISEGEFSRRFGL